MRISLRRNGAGNKEVGPSTLLYYAVFNTYKFECMKFIDGGFKRTIHDGCLLLLTFAKIRKILFFKSDPNAVTLA